MLFSTTMDRRSAYAPQGWATNANRPIPCGDARFVVTIASRPDAGFYSRECAEMAVRMWTGEVNGAGFALNSDERAGAGWPAIRGLHIEIVER
jgi:hypothetical protein